METKDLILIIAAATGLVSAIFSGLTALYAARVKLLAEEAALRIVKFSEDVKTLEKNTNSIKDALVKATGEKEFAAGLKIGTDMKSSRDALVKVTGENAFAAGVKSETDKK